MPVEYKQMDLDAITTYEIDQVAALVIKLAKEIKLPYDEKVIYQKVEGCIKSGLGELFCIIDRGVIVGMIGLVYAPEIWNDKPCATEVAWYVLPQYRGRAGIYLIKEVEKNVKADKIRVGVGSIQLVKMLERLGWKHTKYVVERDF